MERKIEEQRRRKIEQDTKDQEEREKQKILDYRLVCKKQFLDNVQLKEQALKREKEDDKNLNPKTDMLSSIFLRQDKKHISYEKRELQDKRLDLIKDMI